MGLSWADEEAARAEVRSGPQMEWYTVLLREGYRTHRYTQLRCIYVKAKSVGEADSLVGATLEDELVVSIFAGRLIDELGQMEFKEVRGGPQVS